MISLISPGGSYGGLWKIIERERLLSRDQFRDVLTAAKQENRSVTEVLLENQSLPQDKLLGAICSFFELPEVRLKNMVISPLVLNLIPKEVAEQHSVVVFKKIKDVINVATTAPENHQTIEFIRKKTGLEPQLFVTTPDDIRHALRKYKSELSEEFEKIIQDSIQESLAVHESAEKLALFVPMIKMVNAFIENALMQRASDIHCEPGSDTVTIRFRIDGLLQKVVELPKEILPPLVARIKLMANLKLDEHRQPQDGRFNYMFADRDIAVRVSAVPTLNGSKIVLRLLDAQQQNFSLLKLGFNKRDYRLMRGEATRPYGMILVTGPTGSGKTTTLYTLLRRLHRESVNICTIEDPIEYGLNGVNQTQISTDGGITFASGLRALLRQDPNIIMVGEIRDAETASIAMNAAMTGHLVLSTLHTNNAFLTPQRLIEMGVQPYLASSVINMIIGQRLVRKICKHCRAHSHLMSKVYDRYRPLFELQDILEKLKSLELIAQDATLESMKLTYGRGCAKCRGTGFVGRVGIYEILHVTPHVSSLILKQTPADALEAECLRFGMLNMKEDGILKLFTGQTTFDEVMRVTAD